MVRADRGVRFHPRFMEDATGGRAGRLEPASVKMMLAWGPIVTAMNPTPPTGAPAANAASYNVARSRGASPWR
jgi:hypothetical protein